ncbi:FMN-binding negative transcriptional regulator [Psychroflexus aestuariivivens]|uniref:FMN-binding negative transcriptional regulator n=1 Tax=Psychroflexus aestuariivivens TaxID=1795040 RepID=UPI000FD77B1C|nr:FMN-binding negative transcriptional regulator [Psychroflexus aestuariivivens]
MTYLSKDFINKDWQTIRKFINIFPLANLITNHNDKIFVAHVPLVFKKDELIGHIDKRNPQFQHLNDKSVELIFNGGETYVSPSYFKTEELPTYNFAKVHVSGHAHFISEKAMVESLIAMTYQLDHNFHLESSHPKIPILKNYIQGFKIQINDFHGRFKMSQDKSNEHFEIAKSLMEKQQKENMNKFLDLIVKT